MRDEEFGPERELADAIRGFMESLMRPRPLPEELECLPMSQFRCLMTVRRHPDRKMNEIAEHMEIGLPALSQVVTRLVRRGLLRRDRTPDDRRVVLLRLTPRAEELLRQDFAGKKATMRATYQQLGEQELYDVLKGLRTLAEAARRAAAGLDGAPQTPAEDPIIVKLPLQ